MYGQPYIVKLQLEMPESSVNQRLGNTACFLANMCKLKLIIIFVTHFLHTNTPFTQWSKHQANIKQISSKDEANIKQTWSN